MASTIQIKRTATAGRTPNTTNSSNTQYIAAGELALNMADGVLYSSNGSALITIGSSQQALTSNTVSAFSVQASSVNTSSLAASAGSFDNISTTNGISIGNSTVNASVNSTTLFAGNGSVNTFVNTNYIAVSNSSANMQISPLRLFSGNTTANLTIDMTGGAANPSIASANLNAAGIATIQTTTDHNLKLSPGLTVSISGSSAQVFNSSNYTQAFPIISIPTLNTFTFAITSSSSSQSPSSFRSNARKLTKLGRSNGVATAVTSNAHLFANGDTIFINDTILINGKAPLYSYNVPSASPATVTTINSTAFTFPSQYATVNLSIASSTWSTSNIAVTSSGPVYLTINKANTLVPGNKVLFTSPNPASITWGTSKTTLTNYNGTVTASNSTSFTVQLGNKTIGQKATGNSGTFTAGSIKSSYDEVTGNVTSTAYVNQVVGTTSVGGTVGSETPVGITIQTGNGYIMKITSSLIYIGPSANLTGTYISASKIQTGTG